MHSNQRKIQTKLFTPPSLSKQQDNKRRTFSSKTIINNELEWSWIVDDPSFRLQLSFPLPHPLFSVDPKVFQSYAKKATKVDGKSILALRLLSYLRALFPVSGNLYALHRHSSLELDTHPLKVSGYYWMPVLNARWYQDVYIGTTFTQRELSSGCRLQ